MRRIGFWGVVAVLGSIGSVVLGRFAEEGKAPDRVPSAREVVEPVAPAVPPEVLGALQEKRYEAAVEGLDALIDQAETEPTDRAYFGLVKGIALRLDRKLDESRQALRAAIEAEPEGIWSGKIQFEWAITELAADRPSEAERLARREVEALLDPGRKDDLAGVYVAFAEKLLEPKEPTKAPEPDAAYPLLVQARELAKGEALRARLLFQLGRVKAQAGDPRQALAHFSAYLQEYPEGADRAKVRVSLGEAQLAAGQPLPARLTWTDLARDLEGKDDASLQDLRAQALFQIASTYGIPQPGDDNSLNLGVAALRRYLEAYPAHEFAVKAAYQIGEAFAHRGQSEKALLAFRSFLSGDGFRAETEEARNDRAEREMSATYLVAMILQQQGKYDEAIDTFKAYLARFPNGRQSAEAQRAILNTQLMIAQEHRQKKRFEQARAAWRSFVTSNPLYPNVPQILFAIGESFEAEEKYDEAIDAWETLIGKFPDSEPSARGQYQIGLILETKQGNPEGAIERYKQVRVEPWQSRARQRIAVMEATQLTVVTPRAFRSGETPVLKINTRNIEKLTFTAYKLDPEAYFRKKQNLRGVEGLDIGLVAPDAEWTVEVPGYAKYNPVEHEYALEDVPVPGVHVVKVTDETKLQATTLVLGSDLDAILKASKDQVLVFAQDMKTGKGRADARVLIAQEGEIILEGTTGEDGVLLTEWKEPRRQDTSLSYLVLDGSDVAGSGLAMPDRVAQGLSARAYLATDRPAYRPGQEVALRGVVREVKDGQYDHVPESTYKLEVTDSRGRRIVDREVTLSEFGTFHESFAIDGAAPVGDYSMRLYQPGKSEFSGNFQVQAYQLEKIDLTIDLPKTVYFRGETIEGKALARYQYGTPLAGRPIVFILPDGRSLSGTTDAEGEFTFTIETDGFGEEQRLNIAAQLPQDNVSATAAVMLAVRAFRIELTTPRDVYLDDESFTLRVKTIDVLGEPTTQKLDVSILKRIRQEDGTVAEREVETKELTTDELSGEGTLTLSIDDDEGGSYLIRALGTDRFGNPIVAERALTISGEDDPNKLRLLADRQTFKVGEEAEVTLVNRAGAGPALLAWEADRILSYRIVNLEEGSNALAWEADNAQFPNFTLTAARMADTAFYETRLDVRLERDLHVTIEPARDDIGPGEEVEVTITTKDQLGRPVQAEVALALVDQALLRLYRDNLPPIGPFFHDQSRTGAFTTEATNTFRYEPRTEAVSEDLVEEQERMEFLRRGVLALEEARDPRFRMNELQVPQLQSGQAASADRPVPTPAAGPVESDQMMMGMMGGGMGGYGGMGMGQVGGEDLRAARRQMQTMMDRDYSDSNMIENLREDERRALLQRMTRFRSEGGFPMAAGAVPLPSQPPAREQYVETAYWNPAIVTDEDGTATVTVQAPSALSRYQFTARGVTGADTLAGQTTAEIAVKKDFFVELKIPNILTQGDVPRFMARVHHVGIEGPVELRLEAYTAGREEVFPKTIEVEGDGVEEVLFDPFEVPEGDVISLTLSAQAGETTDELAVEVPIRPWGVEAVASASGTASEDRTVFVELPKGRAYENPEMLIVLSPTTKRMLIELALGREVIPFPRGLEVRIIPPPSNTVADRASDLLAATSTLSYLRATSGSDAPEAGRLTDKIRGLVAELVSLQNEDGGWPWVAGRQGQERPSDRLTSARVFWAIAHAEPLGLLTDVSVADRGASYLQQELGKLESSDLDTRASLLHALSTRNRASFEQANSLNRMRQNLSDVALAYLALTFANLDRINLGAEVLGVLGPRSKTVTPVPGGPTQRYWEGQNRHPFYQGSAETTALACLAYARVQPNVNALKEAVEWLLAHRVGFGWQPFKAKGPALAALGSYFGRAEASDDRYRLVITVNDTEVLTKDIQGDVAGEAIRVPGRALQGGGRNRVRFAIEGRGTYGYSVTLAGFTREFGPDQDRSNRSFLVDRRVYQPAEPEFEGKPLPTGFGVAVNPRTFENTVSQVALGGRAKVSIRATRIRRSGEPNWQQDFLVLEEYVPVGATLVEGSVQSNASHHELNDGTLTFYFAPDQYPGNISYDLYGYLPGRYRALPAKIQSAYDPGKLHLGQPGDLQVLAPGEESTDEYKPTPDELYARGKALFEAGRLEDASEFLESLWEQYTLRDEVARDAARILLTIHIQEYSPRKVVQYFEVLKEKAPNLVIPFDEILVVGRAYRDINEHERAYLVWRATAEASYLEDTRVGAVLRQRGQTLEGIAFLLNLWREYPNTAAIESDFFGLSQMVGNFAIQANDDSSIRRTLAEAELTGPRLLLQSIRLIQVFLAQSPDNPLADEASLALVNTYLELEEYEAVVDLARRFAELYPNSTYLDSFQYAEALARFHLGQYDEAVAVADTIAQATYKDASGAEVSSPNKWQAIYILGQIYDARRQPGEAIAYYEQVADRFTDASGAIKALTREQLSLPEVTVIRPSEFPAIAGQGDAALRAALAGQDDNQPTVELDYRNIAEADVKVYPVDLMRLYLTRRNLDGIAGIDLAGITPLLETEVNLGDGKDYTDQVRAIELPIKDEGAYLVMVRGDNRYASGIALVSPLEMEVLEEADAGRVRVTVRDAKSGDFVPKAQVRVIGSGNERFFSGETDLRGVFVAEGVRGTVAAVARKETNQYAFYRGSTHLGDSKPSETPATPRVTIEPETAPDGQGLMDNLRSLNLKNQMQQIERLEQRYELPGEGVQIEQAK